MLDNTLLQPAAALCFLYAGVVAGLLYEGNALLRRRCMRPLLHALFDGGYVLAAGAVFTAALYTATDGVLRAYAFLMAGLGFLLERATLGHTIRDVSFRMIHKS